MRLLTWNINGYRAVAKKGLEQILDYIDADIVCFQEIKAMPEQIDLNEGLYPYQYINSAKRKGYSGTMIASRTEPEKVVYGIGNEELDGEGRVVTVYYPDFALVDVYTPNSQDGLKRIDFRMAWDQAFKDYVCSIDRPVLICGDMNVARTPLDIWDEKDGLGSAGYSDQEKSGMEALLNAGFVDLFRQLYPEKREYTWWSYYSRGRERDQGWRIDYWLASKSIANKAKSVEILGDVFGSDHCPVLLTIDFKN